MVISDIPLVVVMCVIVLLTTRLTDKGSRLTFLRYDVQQRKKMVDAKRHGERKEGILENSKGPS